MDKRTLINILIIALFLGGCTTHNLHPHQYMEVGRGEKALLMTDNSELLDPVGILLHGVTGESLSVSIKSIDGIKVLLNCFRPTSIRWFCQD